MIKTAIAALCACSLFAVRAFAQDAPSTPPWQGPSPWPDRIIVTLEEDPRTSFSVTWRTDAEVPEARAQIVQATARARFDLGARAVTAASESVKLGEKTVDGRTHALAWNAPQPTSRYHSVTFADLEPDTLYAYRVRGAEGHWSEWYQTRTAPPPGEAFRFLYFGDAQDGIDSHWARVVRAAFAQAPDARFAIHAGDLVNIGSRDYEWAAWFQSVGFIHGMIPALPIPGNHEYFDGLRNEDGGQLTALSILWRPQFALPRHEDLPEAIQETVYATRYGDVLVAALDTMAEAHYDAQAQWLDGVLEDADAKWRIVTMHHPIFELLERRLPGFMETASARRDAFLPVLREHGVDIVLQGHDHSYGRGVMTEPLAAVPEAGDALSGTVFVTSSAGAKMYETRDSGWEPFAGEGAVLQRRAENTQFFQVLEVDGDALRYEAYTATGERYDAFRIEKQQGKANRVVPMATDIVEERSFDNTGVYESERFDVLPPRPSRAP